MLIDSWSPFSFQLGSIFWSPPFIYELSDLLAHRICCVFQQKQAGEQSSGLFLMVTYHRLGSWPISLFSVTHFIKFQMITFFSTAVGNICLGSERLLLFMCGKSLWTTHFNRFPWSAERCYFHLGNRTDFPLFGFNTWGFVRFPQKPALQPFLAKLWFAEWFIDQGGFPRIPQDVSLV